MESPRRIGREPPQPREHAAARETQNQMMMTSVVCCNGDEEEVPAVSPTDRWR